MKFDSLIKNNHDLKKNGYKIFRKLHKLEKRANLPKAYGAKCQNGYYVVLSCKGFYDVLYDLYGNYEDEYIKCFLEKTSHFIDYLDAIAVASVTVDSKILSNYLTSFTQFFNRITEDQHIKFSPSKNFFVKWNAGCVMAYTAVWGDR